jgi:hypothetical protein
MDSILCKTYLPTGFPQGDNGVDINLSTSVGGGLAPHSKQNYPINQADTLVRPYQFFIATVGRAFFNL